MPLLKVTFPQMSAHGADSDSILITQLRGFTQDGYLCALPSPYPTSKRRHFRTGMSETHNLKTLDNLVGEDFMTTLANVSGRPSLA